MPTGDENSPIGYIGELTPKTVLVPKKESRLHVEGGVGNDGGGRADEGDAIGLNTSAKASACGPAHIASEGTDEDWWQEDRKSVV